MRVFFAIVVLLIVQQVEAQFAPPAGQPGTTAIHADSSIFVNWATACDLKRGWLNIADTLMGYPDFGDEASAIGKSGDAGTVSLGDGGTATLTFEYSIYNGPGWDFAVFENAFLPDFLELAFVEVSSDGEYFVRFPATSLSDTSAQTSTFGLTDARKVNNLAGKYEQSFGTPFDLEVLKDNPNLDVNKITHVRVIDVVGSLDNQFCSYDKDGRKINDPFPTPFPSCGFDLDAIGVIHQQDPSSLFNASRDLEINAYPNPIQKGDDLQLSYQGEEQLYFINAGRINLLQSFQTLSTSEWNTLDYLKILDKKGKLVFVEKIIVLP